MSTIPTHPSNRKVIEQLVLWGWEVGKVTGRGVEMIGAPIGATAGIRLSVKPATQHDANPQATFKEIYRLTTNSDAEAFWAGPPDAQFWADTVRQARQREHERKEAEHQAQMEKAAERARVFAEKERREREAIAEAEARREADRAARRAAEPKKEKAMARGPLVGDPPFVNVDPDKVGMRSRDVFQVFVNDDRPMTYNTIAQKLGVNINDPKIRSDLASRCSYLFNRGYIDRVMEGTYRITQKGHAINARVQHDIGPPPEPAQAVAKVVVNSVPSSNGKSMVMESLDDTIEAVLDLLLPEGFRGSDIRYIAPWIEVTKEMIEQVTRK